MSAIANTKVGTCHGRIALRNSSTEPARPIPCKASIQPPPYAPSHFNETGPVRLAGDGSRSSTRGPLRENRTAQSTVDSPRTSIRSINSPANSHSPSYSKQPGCDSSVRSWYRSRCEQMLFVIPQPTSGVRPNITAGMPTYAMPATSNDPPHKCTWYQQLTASKAM